MNTIGKVMFRTAHRVAIRGFYPAYQRLVRNQWERYEVLKEIQDEQLRTMVSFAYKNVPYYRKVLNNRGIEPSNIRCVEDLVRLPILDKEDIRNNWEDLKPLNLRSMNYLERSTGGTTGTPMRYRMSRWDRDLGNTAMMYRGWGYGGYQLGDRMVLLGGSSIEIGNKSWLLARMNEISRNLKMLSSFDMGDSEMESYRRAMNSFKPKFLRGYPSAITLFVQWLDEHNLKTYRPKAVFTTAETLYPYMRNEIQRILDCEVYDTYGLNDGGVSAYECNEHRGLHIDTERSIMEIVDAKGNQLESGEGEILATSLHNYAMPFIRYRTGDVGRITITKCPCGRPYKLLEDVGGRTVDILVTPEGKRIHGWFFLYIFWKYSKGVKEYRVIQETVERIIVQLVVDNDFDNRQLDYIREVVRGRSEGWKIEFQFVQNLPRTESGKIKFIENRFERGPSNAKT